jgi:hypothetical protein
MQSDNDDVKMALRLNVREFKRSLEKDAANAEMQKRMTGLENQFKELTAGGWKAGATRDSGTGKKRKAM